jgi:hypothetical protein
LKGIQGLDWTSLPFGDEYYVNLRRGLARAFFHQAAKLQDPRVCDLYVTVNTNQQALLAADSVLVRDPEDPNSRNPKWIVYTTFNYVTSPQLTCCTTIELEWIAHLRYFDDKNLAKKGSGEYKQPLVRHAIQAARAYLSNTDA